MADNDQTISMTIDVNGKEWTQTSNGGENVLAWYEFNDGGDITVTFNKVSASTIGKFFGRLFGRN